MKSRSLGLDFSRTLRAPRVLQLLLLSKCVDYLALKISRIDTWECDFSFIALILRATSHINMSTCINFVSMTAWTIHQRQHRVLFKFYCVLLILLARKWINKSKSLKCSQLSKIANCLCAWMVLRVWRDPITSAKLWEKLLKKYEKMICYLDIDRSTLIYSKSFAAWINLLNFVKINWVKSLKFFAIVSCSPSNFVNWRQR